MSFNFHPARGRAIAAARAGCLAAALVALAPAARAQALFDFTDLPPGRIARGLESSGYELRGPLMRRGDVYVADVAGQGVRYRLVLDARTGQLLERYPMHDLLDERPRWRERNLAEEFDGPPRAGFDSDDDADSAPPRRRAPPGQVARGDLAPPGQVARGDLAPPPPVLDGDDAKAGGADTLEHAKPKPRVVKHKPAPVASTSPKASEPTAPGETPQGDAATSAQPAPRPAATPEPAKTVVASPPADTPKPVAPAPSPEPPRTEATKPVAQADPAPVPTPKPSPKAKAINDLPVNTLD